MSGTSCDGLDCCDVNIDIDSNYNLQFHINSFHTIPFCDLEKKFLLSVREKEDEYSNSSREITDLFIAKIEENMDIPDFFYSEIC